MTDPPVADRPAPQGPAPLGSAPPAEAVPAFRDAWPWARPVRLTGWMERNGFTPLWAAALVFVLAFLLFQLVVSPLVIAIGIGIDVARSGGGSDVGALMEGVLENGRLLLTANTVGQAVGFGLLAVAVARLHSPDAWEYLRVRRPDGPGLALAALGWATLYPAVLWAGQLNESLPQPEWLRQFEQSQVELLEGALLGSDLSTAFLFVALALTPAICEELLFRGYLQRQVERRGGAVASIVVVGVLFGVYHLRLSQVVPLSMLGIYMGFVVWATGSLWAGVAVHLLNNGLAVAVAAVAKHRGDVDMAEIEAATFPWYLGIGGLVLTYAVVQALLRRRHAVVGDRDDAEPVTAPPHRPAT
ncbi:CPBP family intramembrane glutamic endopeptidase [Rubrivirga litoralis]|uniref:CPBP family intramembrane glutamic endopeptidase n=1 Tax=Rubrivirga litoralis TaxID=3075598 RepID=A0ABU3BT50_9BACT|nr:CPBP family intramembrane glutamic endopeptidase [Rubrivirga sp. F394]MDT0632462.1 CPBP family intramembrane glutamic endopeptidase [Rubrivirga sp. F394]